MNLQRLHPTATVQLKIACSGVVVVRVMAVAAGCTTNGFIPVWESLTGIASAPFPMGPWSCVAERSTLKQRRRPPKPVKTEQGRMRRLSREAAAEKNPLFPLGLG
jgi:hypothetical protein